jgi:NADH-ubiquinone oxidoreductase MWFE subunit
MPYAAVFPLVIICGCFCTTAFLLGSVNYLQEGKRERDIEVDAWKWTASQRDKLIYSHLKDGEFYDYKKHLETIKKPETK